MFDLGRKQLQVKTENVGHGEAAAKRFQTVDLLNAERRDDAHLYCLLRFSFAPRISSSPSLLRTFKISITDTNVFLSALNIFSDISLFELAQYV